jgi:hypothetical protein
MPGPLRRPPHSAAAGALIRTIAHSTKGAEAMDQPCSDKDVWDERRRAVTESGEQSLGLTVKMREMLVSTCTRLRAIDYFGFEALASK